MATDTVYCLLSRSILPTVYWQLSTVYCLLHYPIFKSDVLDLTLQVTLLYQVYFLRQIQVFSEKTPIKIYSTVHALGLVSASTTPWECSALADTGPRVL